MTEKTNQRNNVTYDDVCRAVDQLNEMGEKVTQRKVLEMTGGTFKTISEYLKRRTQHDVDMTRAASYAADPIIQKAKTFGEEIWAAATQSTRETFEKNLISLRAQIEQMESDRSEAAEKIKNLEEELLDVRHRLATAENNAKDFAEIARGLDLEGKTARAKEREAKERIEKLLREQVEAFKNCEAPRRTYPQGSLQPQTATRIDGLEN
jgi:hypothetical protein